VRLANPARTAPWLGMAENIQSHSVEGDPQTAMDKQGRT
jgi:hypothetical protein